MNFVYICRDGENEELRYSIRSVLSFYPESDIYIFGGKPRWYLGNFVEIKDSGNKFNNISNCYEAICNSSINNFVLMNDDFYILKKPDSFEYYYDGLLEEKIQSHINKNGLSKYSRVLLNANKKLKRMGVDQPLNYDIHVPMFFDTQKLSQVVSISQAPRSAYGNIFNVGGIQIEDVKIYKDSETIPANNYFLSTEDNSFSLVRNKIISLFPEKTTYEK